MFRLAFAQGRLFPLWTALAQNGWGSPWPFFYHRLFYSLAGALALASGPLVAVKTAIVLFLAIGAVGMAAAAASLGLSPALRVGSALLLLFSPYTYTDWLVRGAVGEFSAGMLVPWLFAAAIAVVRGRPRSGAFLGLVWSVLFFAHSVVFLFGGAVVLLALLLAWPRTAGRPFPGRLQDAAWCCGLLLLLAGPSLAGALLLRPLFGLEVLAGGPFDVLRNFEPLTRYVVDSTFRFGHEWRGFSIEIGRFIVAPLLLGAVLLRVLRVPRRASDMQERRARLLLWISAAFFLLLQLPISSPFYRMSFAPRLIQFPWRLLVFLTPLAILALASTAGRLMQDPSRPWIRRAAGVAFLAIAARQVVWGASMPIAYQTYDRPAVSRALRPDGLATSSFLSGGLVPRRGRLSPPPSGLVTSEGCGEVSVDPPAAAAGPIELDVVRVRAAGAGCRVFLNQFATPFLSVSAPDGAVVGATDAGTFVVTAGGGPIRVVLGHRGLFAVIRAVLARRSSGGT